MSAFLASNDKVLPANGVNLDCGGRATIMSFAREILEVDLTWASVVLTSLALLVSSINTVTCLQLAGHTTLSTNGWFEQANILIQLKIVEYLREQEQREAAVWFEHNMTGEEGKWMLAQGFLGAANNNMGQESFYKYQLPLLVSSHQHRMISASLISARLQNRGVHRSDSLTGMRRMTLWCERSRRTHHSQSLCCVLYSKKCRESQTQGWTSG